MPLLKKAIVPLARPLFIPKEGGLTKEDLIIESSGNYRLFEQPDYFVIKNDECCRSIQVTVKVKE